MDIDKWIRNKGLYEVPNPQYTKKNGLPPTIIVPDVGPDNSPLINMALEDARNAYSISAKEAAKYNRYGINYSPNYQNIDAQLADAQSGWNKMVNALGQTIVSEIGLGTIGAFTDLADFVSSNILHLTEADYQNPASEQIKEWQDYFNNEVAPIYTNPDINIQNGGLTDIGWYAKNIPSIASSLTLFIPGAGITKGLSFLTKASVKGMSIAKATGNARRWLSGVRKGQSFAEMRRAAKIANNPLWIARGNEAAKIGTQGLLMRTMENYQESRDVHMQTYENALDKLSSMSDEDYAEWINNNKGALSKDTNINDRNAVAKDIAKQAADRTFTMDFSNLIFDVIQLYGLKNFGKGMKAITGRGIANAERQAVSAAEELVTGTAPKAIEKGFLTKFKEYGSDVAKDFGKSFLEESTEGIEEAVNAIAQQEGITYGKMLLAGQGDNYKLEGIGNWGTLGIANVINTWRYLQNPMHEYLTSPELQEGAFWGVIGGMVFGGAASGMQRANMAWDRYNAKKKAKKLSEKTGEEINATDASGENWTSLFELPEQKAAKLAIQNRIIRLKKYQDLLAEVEKGKDVFAPLTKDKTYQDIEGDEETVKEAQARIRAKLEKQFISEMAMEAMNTGTFDSLLEYFSNDKVKQAMIKIGMINADEATSRVESIKQQLKNVQQLYNDNSAHLFAQASYLNATGKEDIPIEYLNIIAKNNTDRMLAIEEIDAQIQATLEQISELENKEHEIDNSFDPVLNRTHTKLQALITFYSYLKADEEALEREKSSLNAFDYERRKRYIKEQQKSTIKELANINASNVLDSNQTIISLANVFNAIKYSKHFFVPEGTKYDNRRRTYSNKERQDLIESDEKIIEELENLFKSGWLENKGYNVEYDTIIQQAKQLDNQMERSVGIHGLANRNATLYAAYQTIAGLEMNKSMMNNRIVRTTEEISSEVDYWHNSMNEARKKALETASDGIIDLYTKYNNNANGVMRAITSAYHRNKTEARSLAERFMKPDDVDKFMSYMDIFNFSNTSNDAIFEYLDELFSRYDAINHVAQNQVNNQNNETNDETNGETETSSEASQGSQNQPTINPSSEQQQSVTSNERGQNSLNLQPQRPQTERKNRRKTNVQISINSRGEIVEINKTSKKNNNTIPAFINDDNTIEVDIRALPVQRQLKLLRTNLFEVPQVDVLNVDWVIKENPVLRRATQQSSKLVIDKQGIVDDINNLTPEEQTEVANTTPVEENIPQEQTPIGSASSTPTGATVTIGGQPLNNNNQEKTTHEKLLESALDAEYWNFTTSNIDDHSGGPLTVVRAKYENGRLTFRYYDDEAKDYITWDATDTFGKVAEEKGVKAAIESAYYDGYDADKVTYKSWGYSKETEAELDALAAKRANGLSPSSTGGETQGGQTTIEGSLFDENSATNETSTTEPPTTEPPTTENSTTESTDESDIDAISKENFELGMHMAQTIGELFPTKEDGHRDYTNADIDAIAQQAHDKIFTERSIKLFGEERLQEIFNQKIASFRTLKEKFAKPINQAASDLTYQSRIEETSERDFSPIYKSTVDAFMTEYAKIVDLPIIDGKQIVRLEDVLRICHQLYGGIDKTAATTVYNILKLYLNSNDGSNKYTVLDNDVKTEEAVSRLNQNSAQLAIERNSNNLSSYRIDIDNCLTQIEAGNEMMRRVFDNLKIGDKVTLNYNEKRNCFIIVKDGFEIGAMPLPTLSSNGSYIQDNKGWHTDVNIDANGNIISSEFERIYHIFTSKDADCVKIRELIVKYLLSSNKEIENNPLVDEFAKVPLIQSMIQDSVNASAGGNSHQWFKILNTDGDVYIHSILDYLARLYKYNTQINDITDETDYNDAIHESLEQWYKKLYNTYNVLSNMYEFTDIAINPIEVSITKLTEGNAIRAVDNDAIRIDDERNYDLFPYSDEVIVKPEEASIGITNFMNQVVNFSDGRTQQFEVSSDNNTLLSLNTGNKKINLVHVKGVNTNDMSEHNKNGDFKKICVAIKGTIDISLANLIQNPSLESLDKLYETLSYIIRSSDIKNDNIIPILASKFTGKNIRLERNGKRLRLQLDNDIVDIYVNQEGSKNYVTISTPSFNKGGTMIYRANGGRPIGVNHGERRGAIVSEGSLFSIASTAILSFLNDNTSVNISINGIRNDVGKQQFAGFVTYDKNGKFNINIPGGRVIVDYNNEFATIDNSESNPNRYTKQEVSYSQWLIKNGLIKANVAKNGNTNFMPRSENPKENQRVEIGLPSNGDIELERKRLSERPHEYVEKNSDRALFDTLAGIANSDSHQKGIELMTAMMGIDKVNALKQIVEDLQTKGVKFDIFDLLPRELNYDRDYNYYDENGEPLGPLASSAGEKKQPKYNIYNEQGQLRKHYRRLNTRNRSNLVIGSVLLNMMSSTDVTKNRRGTAIRKLIHENLHNKLGENQQAKEVLLNSIAKIYFAFQKRLEQDFKNKPNDVDLQTLDKIFKPYRNKPNLRNRMLEEFLVESLTNRALFEYLNNIESNEKIDNKPKSLLNLILDAIIKFFGWTPVRDNTLMAQQVNAIKEWSNLIGERDSEVVEDNEIKENNNEKDTTTQEPIDTVENYNNPINEEPVSEEPTSEQTNNLIESDKYAEDNGEVDLEDFIDEDADDSIVEEDSTIPDIERNKSTNVNIQPFTHTVIGNLSSLSKSLPIELQSNFEDNIDNGIISITCK